jgi:hypothetical protein
MPGPIKPPPIISPLPIIAVSIASANKIILLTLL